jgi:hypothetical protein
MKIFSPQITGSLEVDGNSTMTGSLIVTGGITGSLLGTASFADNATSASFATTASFALNAASAFPFTGSAVINGSLILTGSATFGDGGTHYNAINIQNRGTNNTITTDGNSVGTIAIGNSNITGKGAAIIIGQQNVDSTYANGQDNGAIGWSNLFSTGNFTSRNMILGSNLTISGDGNYRIMAGGLSNVSAGGSNNGIFAGTLNRITAGTNDAILGGTSNTASHDNSVVIGGSNISTAAASTVYVPNFDVSGSSTFRQSTVLSGSIRGEVNALSISSNTASLDCALDNFFTLQLVSGSNTFINPSNILPGQTINLRINTTGSATVSFPSSVLQQSGSAYVPTTTTGVDVVTFISFDSTSLLLSNVKNLV